MTTTEDRSADTGVNATGQAALGGSAGPGGKSPAELRAPEERGGLEVSPSVVRKVAQRAADCTPGTLRASNRMVGEHGSSARIDGTGNTVDIILDVALRYPTPIQETTAEVRRQVTDTVWRITGYRVRAVQITVSALLPETHPRVR